MKNLFLQDILGQIDGTVIKGSGNPMIQNVTYRPPKIGHHTLLFYRYKDMKIESHLFRKYKSPVVVTDRPDYFKNADKDVILVKVTDIEEAFWKFVRYYRNLFQIPVIGITGTCGKTTTKQMVKHILRKYFKVHSTFLSNNQRSLNLKYLLGIDEDTQAAVFEMPVASPGYLTNAIQYFQPQIRILLNIDVYHLMDCKTPEAYMKAKTEIVHGLDPKSGIIILNADDGNIKKLLDVSRFKRVIFFGYSDGCHFQAKKVSYADGGMEFLLNHQNQTYPVYVPGYGKHNVYNALAAIAATWSAGLGIKESCERLASFDQVNEHLEFRSGVGGCTIIDDTWNVAPLSMASSLEVLQEVSESKTKIALLGYMPQLGASEYAKQQYKKIGEKVFETKVDLLFVVNYEAREIGRKALELGMDSKKVYFCNSASEIYKILKPFLNKDSIILLKIPHRVMVQDSFKKLKQKIMT
ncbi:MAG: UDP-N-acetylmuramoyl-tripeptide--D-alanyl-D-alanine ligase [Peptococcaceae bacterium BRH_c4b]|nr:MAG: UDP-N-acetylmuramoyl-tripeptide--D-alanyl-D-alanine ligase [Peptococcaceae bacterium BRH_c4b]